MRLGEGAVSGDACVVILAGGAASRFGAVTKVLPKCFLPVSADETLMTRLLGQLWEAGFTKTVISTSPTWFPVFDSLLSGYRETRGAVVLSNRAHSAGPLAALGNAMKQIEEPRLLLCLADIFFWENPFRELAAADREAVLSGCPVDRLKSAPSSGFLTTTQGTVESISYRQAPAHWEAFWPGVALFRKTDALPWLDSIAEGPIENLFLAALAQGVRFAYQPCGPFQNVNTMDEWLQLLSHSREPAAGDSCISPGAQ